MHPTGPQERPQNGFKPEGAKSANLASRVGGSVIFGSRGRPDEDPNGVKIVSKVKIEMEFYKNQLGEGSERARRANKK